MRKVETSRFADALLRELGDFCEKMAVLLSQMDTQGKVDPEVTDLFAVAVHFKEQGKMVRRKYMMFKSQMKSMAA